MIYNKCFDLDGTLVNYWAEPKSYPIFNWSLIETIRDTNPTYITIATNQGGLQFGEMGIEKYPTVPYFTKRIAWLADALATFDIYLIRVFASLHHPKGDVNVERQVKDTIAGSLVGNIVTPLTDPFFRKPAPRMLQMAQCDVYYGDSEIDEQAAQAAGVPFIKVERFHG